MIAIDSETTGPNLYRGCEPFVFTACDDEGSMHYWEFEVNVKTRKVIYDMSVAKDMIDVLDEHDEWIFHNATFDIRALEIMANELNLKKLKEPYIQKHKSIHDTMMRAHIYDSLQKMGLKEQAMMRLELSNEDEKTLGKDVQKAARIAKRLGWYTALSHPTHPSLIGSKANYKCDYWTICELARRGKWEGNSLKKYALMDVERTMGLHIVYRDMFTPEQESIYDWHRQLLLPVKRMQSRGFHVHMDRLEEVHHQMKQEQVEVLASLRKQTYKGFNPESDPQLKKHLFDTLKLPVIKRTKTGTPAGDKDTLKKYLDLKLKDKQYKFVSTLVQFKKYTKTIQALETYRQNQQKEKLYTNIKVTGTKTTRVSSENPNIQNVGKNKVDLIDYDHETEAFTVRQVFGPCSKRIWYCGDYSQLQIRIFAFAANDKTLIRGFEQGYDAHTFVAQRMFRVDTPDELQRRAAKAVNFGIIFGAGPAKINGMAGNDDAYDLFVEQFPSVHKFIRQCETIAKRTGYIKTMGGYPLRVPYQTAYKAANYIIQGTEGEMVKEAMIQCDKYLYHKPDLWMLMQVHDELIFEGIRSRNHISKINRIAQIMVEAGDKYGVLCKVDFKCVESTWDEGTKLELAV